MKINPKFNPILPSGAGKVENNEPSQVQKEGASESVKGKKPFPPVGKQSEQVEEVKKSPLQEIVAGKDLSDPSVKQVVGKKIIKQTIGEILNAATLTNIDIDHMVTTFQEYIQENPQLKDVFEAFLENLSKQQ